MKAYIYFKAAIGRTFSKDYSGEGLYALVDENGTEINQHFCSSRGFAEGDLTTTFEAGRNLLNEKGITEVYSNDRLVYTVNESKLNDEIESMSHIAEMVQKNFLDYFASGINFTAYDNAIDDLNIYIENHRNEFLYLADGELYNKFFTLLDKFYKDYDDPIF